MLSVRLDATTPAYGRMTAVLVASSTSRACMYILRSRPDTLHEIIQVCFTLEGTHVCVHREVVRVRDMSTGEIPEFTVNTNTDCQRPIITDMITAFTGVPAESIAFVESSEPQTPHDVREALTTPTRRYTLEVSTLEVSTLEVVNLAETAALTRAARHACSVVIRRLPQDLQASMLATLVTEGVRSPGEEPDGEDTADADGKPSRDPTILPALQAHIHDSIHVWFRNTWPSVNEAEAA